MNAFELATVTSPLAGVAAGVILSRGQSVSVTTASVVFGIALGLVVYPGLVILVAKALEGRIDLLAEQPGTAARLIGTGIVAYAVVAPFVAWFIAAAAIPQLIRSVT